MTLGEFMSSNFLPFFDTAVSSLIKIWRGARATKELWENIFCGRSVVKTQASKDLRGIGPVSLSSNGKFSCLYFVWIRPVFCCKRQTRDIFIWFGFVWKGGSIIFFSFAKTPLSNGSNTFFWCESSLFQKVSPAGKERNIERVLDLGVYVFLERKTLFVLFTDQVGAWPPSRTHSHPYITLLNWDISKIEFKW